MSHSALPNISIFENCPETAPPVSEIVSGGEDYLLAGAETFAVSTAPDGIAALKGYLGALYERSVEGYHTIVGGSADTPANKERVTKTIDAWIAAGLESSDITQLPSVDGQRAHETLRGLFTNVTPRVTNEALQYVV